jgi:ADP-heptose:LPS heptosyltransferase
MMVRLRLLLTQKIKPDLGRLLPLIKVKKYLIIRFSSIGDIVLTTPVIRCLKQQTNAEVHYITKAVFKEVLADNPHIDKLHTFENEITEILPDLKKENYDFIIDLHNNLRSLRLKKILKRPSAAFPKLNRQKFLLTNFKWDVLPDKHIVDRYFEAVKSLGVTSDIQGLDYFIPEKNRLNLESQSIPDDFIAFAIGAKFATKRLPNHKIIEVIQKTKSTVVLLGGPEDAHNAAEIKLACPHCISMVGKVSLSESASIIEHAKSVITHDTGLMHIAAAFKKPIVSIWGNTTPSLGMYPYLPSNPELYSIHEVNVKCRPCSKIGYEKCPKRHFKCMNEQNVEEIVKAVNQGE